MNYKIVKIIDERMVVVNAGKYDVREGDILRIIVPSAEKIIDPDSGEILGSLDYIKARIKVKNVYDRMCICTNEKTYGTIIEIANGEPRPKPLDVDLTEVSGGYDSQSSVIKIGDIVEKL